MSNGLVFVHHNIFIWLAKILKERFGPDFIFREADGRLIEIGLIGELKSIYVVHEPRFFDKSAALIPCGKWSITQELDWGAPVDGIPIPGLSDPPARMIEPYLDGFRINYDIFGLIYWVLSRSEEVNCKNLDEHGRFPAINSHAYEHGYLERPIVDEWLDILKQVIQKLWPQLELKQHIFNMQVSHDVDGPSRYGFQSMKEIIHTAGVHVVRRHDLVTALQALWVWLNSKRKLHPLDPENTFDWIMDSSEKRGLLSAFYFICGRTDPVRDADYEIEHPAIRDLMRKIYARGHEIGLHPSYGTYQHPETLRSEADRLRRVCAEEDIAQHGFGGRMHYLRWTHPLTMRAWDDAGMSYDSTLGYADRPGFRCGTCFEYPAFDPVAGEMLNLRIRPLVAMECTVIASRYLGLGNGDAALAKFVELKDACRAVNGSFTLLWHNSQMCTPQDRALYEAVLDA